MSLSINTTVTKDTISASVNTSGSVMMYHYWYLNGTYNGGGILQVGETSATHDFSGLTEDTVYWISVSVYKYVNNEQTLLDSGEAWVIPNRNGNPTEKYWAKIDINQNTAGPFIGWEWSAKGYVDINVEYWTNDGNYWYADGTFLGYGESSTQIVPDYPKSGTIAIRSESTDESNPTTITLYPIWAWRPDDWSWPNEDDIVAGKDCYLKASDWNEFIERIKGFAWFKQITLDEGNITAAQATKGSRMLASQANAARSLINQLGSTIAAPAEIKSGDVIKASFIIGLKDALNGVPENPYPS